MLLLCNQQYRPELDASTLQIQQAASDPIPTCTFTLEDTGSIIPIAEFQEVVVIDEQSIPNPTLNLILNPTMNPYTTSWGHVTYTGISYSQQGGGGQIVTMSNATTATDYLVGSQTGQPGTTGQPVTPGQAYIVSVYVQAAALVGTTAFVQINFFDATGTNSVGFTNGTPVTPGGSPSRISVTMIAPVGAVYARIGLYVHTTSGTNSGTVTFTNAQLEPVWFTSIGQTYPTPFCASGQTNCTVLPNGTTVRQQRIFAGFTNLIEFDNFAGQNRQIHIEASGPAWLMELTIISTIYTTKSDSFMINDFVSRSFTGIFTTNHVQTGVTFSSYAPNDDTIRKCMDDFATSSTYRWYIDPYYDIWYLPSGFYSTLFNLSDNPDNVMSFVYSKYKRTLDFTQPCNRAHVLVSGGPNVVRVTDGASYGQYNTTFFDRKIDDSGVITTNTDAYQRGLAEITAFSTARVIIAVQTDQRAAQPLTPGNSIIIINSVDSIGPASYLIQKVVITWLGSDKTQMARFLYDAELGAYNANLTNYLVRTARGVNQQTSASLNLAQENICVIERIAVAETESHTP